MNTVDYRLLYLLQDGRCFYCQKPMQPTQTDTIKCGNGWTRDHFFARAKGNGLLDNVVLACAPCNGAKGWHNPSTEQRARFDKLLAGYEAAAMSVARLKAGE